MKPDSVDRGQTIEAVVATRSVTSALSALSDSVALFFSEDIKNSPEIGFVRICYVIMGASVSEKRAKRGGQCNKMTPVMT